MKIPKEIAEKVIQYQDGQKAFQEVVQWLNENTGSDGVDIEDLFIADKPTGHKQNRDEFCEQHQGFIEDSYYGKYYHPIDGSDKYIGYRYSC